MRYRLIVKNASTGETAREDFDTQEALNAKLATWGVPDTKIREGYWFGYHRVHRWFAINDEEDLFTVSGTEFVFPALPADEDNPAREKRLERRRSILDKAMRVRYTKPRPPRPARPPRPGNGVFKPKPGDPGSTVRVTLVDESHTVPSITVEGCVLFPAPGGARAVWVSLWDGKTPIRINLDKSRTAAEYRTTAAHVEELRARAAELRGSA